jgi:hypothetical protein
MRSTLWTLINFILLHMNSTIHVERAKNKNGSLEKVEHDNPLGFHTVRSVTSRYINADYLSIFASATRKGI